MSTGVCVLFTALLLRPGQCLIHNRCLINICGINEQMPSLSIHFPFYPHHSIENTHNNVMGPIPTARSSGLFSVLVLVDPPVEFGMVEPLLLETQEFSPGAIFLSQSVFFFFKEECLALLHPCQRYLVVINSGNDV